MAPTVHGSSHEIDKRKKEVEKILKRFVDDWHSKDSAVRLTLIDNAAQKISEKYFELLEGAIKIYLNPGSYANKFKIASGSEISVMFLLPIRIDDPSYSYIELRQLNAKFAMYLAFVMISAIYFEEGEDVPEQINHPALSKITHNHILWLSRLNTRDLLASPTFINSNFWEAYFFASTGFYKKQNK